VTEPLEDVWTTRDYPVLREVTERIDSGQSMVSSDEIAAAIGLSSEDARLAGLALERRGFVDLATASAAGPVFFQNVDGAAYLVTGLHPDGDDALSGLVQALQQAAEQTGDEDERSRLRKAADGLLNVSREVMVGVMTAFLSQKMPG
jgi:hypothetical protein